MKQTETYKFNLIETSDDFGPEKLNENAEAVERELLAARADAAAGDAAVRTEFAAGDAAVRAEFAAADKTLSNTIAAVEKGANFVHLAGPVDNGSSFTSTVIDLSRVDMSQYRALLIFARGYISNTISAGGLSTTVGQSGHIVLWLMQTGVQDAMAGTGFYSVNGAPYTIDIYRVSDTRWNSISQISLSKVYFVDVYGIKA